MVALIGPRQAGKTTLARLIVSPDSPNYYDLEGPISLARLTEPMTELARLRGIVIIDEVQRRPELSGEDAVSFVSLSRLGRRLVSDFGAEAR